MPQETLAEPLQYEEEIKRSRFLVFAAPCPDFEAVQRFLQQHHVTDASHNCYAWRIGQTYRFNDDGEPSGTAGRPILQAIDGQGLDQVAVLVVRWFGGIKLGAGGLVRAYGGSAARCLQAGLRRALIEYTDLRLFIPFDQLGNFHRFLAASQAQITLEKYLSDGLAAELRLPVEHHEALLEQLREASGAAIHTIDAI